MYRPIKIIGLRTPSTNVPLDVSIRRKATKSLIRVISEICVRKVIFLAQRATEKMSVSVCDW
jgi:hypothetical protein